MLGRRARRLGPGLGHVAFFDAYPRARGGAQRSLRLMADGLRDRGWEVSVLLPTDGPLHAELDADGVPVEVVTAPAALSVYGGAMFGVARIAAFARLPGYWLRLRRRLHRRADALHAQDLRGVLLAGPAARLAGIPVVWHVHADADAPRLSRLAARIAARVVVTSPGLAVPGRADHDVVPNGVSVPDVVPARAPARPPRLVTLSRLYPVKQVEVLLDASALLRAAGVDHRIDVLGDVQPGYEDYAERLHTRCAELGLGDVVTFHGHVDDPRPVLDGAAVYVQTSSHEMQPLAILEAMARGVPVVATAVGGVPEVVRDGDTGRLVPSGDAQGLADAVAGLLADPIGAQAVGARGHAFVREHFAAAAVADSIDALYRDLLGVGP